MKIVINIDDQLIVKVKGFFSRRNIIAAFAIVFMMGVALYAAEKKFTIFAPRTPIYSSEINDNFALMPPVGTIVAFAGLASKVPEGWLPCDGRVLNKNTYKPLFDVIEFSWGKQSNDAFHLPDLRGRFLRGVNGNGRDDGTNTGPLVDADVSARKALYDGNIGNNVGSYQDDAIRNISGEFGNVFGDDSYNSATLLFQRTYNGSTSVGGASDGDYYYSYTYNNYYYTYDASRVVPTGSDNRPKNAYVYYIIRAK
ncbi:MAG: phage tail protein [Leptospirales bacterium]|nr:phage tail protein [Leptospirales bacterium]